MHALSTQPTMPTLSQVLGLGTTNLHLYRVQVRILSRDLVHQWTGLAADRADAVERSRDHARNAHAGYPLAVIGVQQVTK